MTTTTPHSTTATTQAELDTVLLDLLPRQGQWDAEGYLWLTDWTNRLIEFTDGYIEVLPMPTPKHQHILKYLFLAFHAFVQPRGVVLFSPLRVRIRASAFREPDLVLLRDARDPRQQERYWTGADLVLEVVSPDKRSRDLIEKRGDYARAGIPEYWIVDPQAETITILRLDDGRYVEHGVFGRGASATSALLAGFAVAADAVFDAGQRTTPGGDNA